ncbi:uncharacterized protein At3g60930, chloroplastic-like [Lycium barbarum]|uniref:uncharacterized protein At3g60930, chloroplastic-like n=1 Tax=Lycium barbarum TaxID=112863 RepID=UPI00293F03DC|nr:uncharacterized protein At3g60930, chloroplastic-like [Lycium barbarum]
MDEDRDRGLPKGSMDPRPESGAEPTASAPEFDSAGASRALAAAAAAKRKRPSERGQKSKKKAMSVARTSRDEVEPDIIIRRVDADSPVAPIPEEAVSISPLPSAAEGLLVPVSQTGETSSKEDPLQRTRRSGEAAAAEVGQKTGPVLETEIPVDGRETEKYLHLLQEKEEELSRAVALSNLQPELDAAKIENRQLRSELVAMTEYNRSLEAEKISLSRDNAQISSRLGELETTFSQLREELDLVKSDASSFAERNRLLESESARYQEHARVFEEKVESRARMCDDLKNELKEMADANDNLQAELQSAIQMQDVLGEARDALAAKLAQAEADLDEALKSIEAAEAQATIVAEHEKWKSRRITLEQAEHGFTDLPTLIAEAKRVEGEAKDALGSDSDDSERTESERPGSIHSE